MRTTDQTFGLAVGWAPIFLPVFLIAFLIQTAAAGAAEDNDIAYFQAQLAPYRAKPDFVAPGPPFDARACTRNKKILTIPVTTANPFTQKINQAMKKVADMVGFKLLVWENQGRPPQWLQGINLAIGQGFDLIDLLGGADPRVLVPQIQAARKAGIAVVASHFSGLEQTVPNVTHTVPIDYFKAGQLLVDWAVVQTKGRLNGLVLYTSGAMSTDSMMAGIDDQLALCAACRVVKKNILVTDWAMRIQPTVQSALLADPTINYIIAMYDSMTQFIVPAVMIVGATERAPIVTFNGTDFVVGFVQQGKVAMDIGENLDWVGYAIIDAEMRILCGLEPVKDPKIPFYLFTPENAADAGTPPRPSLGYGDSYVAGYRKLWGLP